MNIQQLRRMISVHKEKNIAVNYQHEITPAIDTSIAISIVPLWTQTPPCIFSEQRRCADG